MIAGLQLPGGEPLHPQRYCRQVQSVPSFLLDRHSKEAATGSPKVIAPSILNEANNDFETPRAPFYIKLVDQPRIMKPTPEKFNSLLYLKMLILDPFFSFWGNEHNVTRATSFSLSVVTILNS